MDSCIKCGKELDGGMSHTFCGYGYHIRFCATCCPREYDDRICDDMHEETQESSS